MALLIALLQEYFSSPNGLLYDEIFLRLTEFFLISLFECIGGEDCPNDSSQIALQIKKQSESMDMVSGRLPTKNGGILRQFCIWLPASTGFILPAEKRECTSMNWL